MIEIAFVKKLQSASGQMSLDLYFQLNTGDFLTIYGKSGAGKTSALRILAGLLSAEKGRIIVNGNVWLDSNAGINLKTQNRQVGFLFQDYALFPNMTVRENLMFALNKGENDKIVNELIELIELGNLQSLKPDKLSGGQQQRVALARALVQKPDLLMLDEPLSALDQEMRTKLQDHILNVHREYRLSTILVSHDVSEITKMSDQVMVLDHGKITNSGAPSEVFSQQLGPNNFPGKTRISIEKKVGNLLIRNARDADFNDVYDFVNWLEEQEFDRQKQQSIFRENISNPNNIYLVAVKENETVGFIDCHTQNLLHHSGLIGEIQEMYVKEEHRNDGIGKHLLETLKVEAQKAGILQLEVTSNVRRTEAHLFYENANFIHTSNKLVLKLDSNES